MCLPGEKAWACSGDSGLVYLTSHPGKGPGKRDGLWKKVNVESSSDVDRVSVVEADESGNLYTAEWGYNGSVYGIGYYYAKYDKNGNQLWRKIMDSSGGHGSESLYGLDIAGNGDLFLTGRYIKNDGAFVGLSTTGSSDDHSLCSSNRVFWSYLSHVRHTLPQFSLLRTSFSQLFSLSSFPTSLRFCSAHLAHFLSGTAPGSIFHPALLCWFPCFFSFFYLSFYSITYDVTYLFKYIIFIKKEPL